MISRERKMKSLFVLTALGAAAFGFVGEASALNETVARKCLKITLEAIPRPKEWRPYKGGDPTAARAREAFYRDCVAKEEKK